MATKKQKREAAAAKRAAFEEELRLSGLRAQEADRRRTAAIRAKTQMVIDEINVKRKKILDKNFIEISREFATDIQELAVKGSITQLASKRLDWFSFLHSLNEKNRRLAVDAYYDKIFEAGKGLAGDGIRESILGRKEDAQDAVSGELSRQTPIQSDMAGTEAVTPED